MHDNYAGLSAFVSGHGGEAERGARFVAVGVLIPLNDGRLGRAWLHTPQLKELAKYICAHIGNVNVSNMNTSELVANPSRTGPLEQYWDGHRIREEEQSEPSESRFADRRGRTLSTATAVFADQTLPPEHPALSVLEYLDTFGPLVFPLHRAALLRQRILLVRPPPVQLTCDYGECFLCVVSTGFN